MSEPVFHCDLQSTVGRFTVYRFLFCPIEGYLLERCNQPRVCMVCIIV